MFVINLSTTTEDELWSIWAFNLRRYGAEHADRYVALLRQGIQTLASEHGGGHSIEGFPGLRSLAFRRNPRGDGHLAVYEVDPDAGTVSFLHVFQTKQDAEERLRRAR